MKSKFSILFFLMAFSCGNIAIGQDIAFYTELNGITYFRLNAIVNSSQNYYTVGEKAIGLKTQASLVCLNSSGQIQYQKSITSPQFSAGFHACFPGNKGSVYAIGYSDSQFDDPCTYSVSKALIVQFGFGGETLMEKRFYENTSYNSFTSGFQHDNGFLYLGGTVGDTAQPNTNSIPVVVCLDSLGNLVWEKRQNYLTTHGENPYVKRPKVFPVDDESFILSSAYDIAKFDLDGNQIWHLPGNLLTPDFFNVVDVCPFVEKGLIVCVNSYNSQMIFYIDSLGNSLLSIPTSNACGLAFKDPDQFYVAKIPSSDTLALEEYDVSLNMVQERFFSCEELHPSINDICYSIDRGVSLTGINVVSPGTYRGIVIKFGTLGIPSCYPNSLPELSQPNDEFLVFPNPAGDFIELSFPEGYPGPTVEIFSITGALLMRTSMAPDENRISTKNLPDGCYLLKAGSRSSRFCVIH